MSSALRVSAKRPLAAVVLLMIVVAELLAVIAATHQVPPAPSVTVIEASVIGTITVSLPFTARISGSAASSAVIIPTRTPLTYTTTNLLGGPDIGRSFFVCCQKLKNNILN